MMKKLLLLMIPWVSIIFCGEPRRPQGIMETLNYLGESLIVRTKIAALLNKDFKKGLEAEKDMIVGPDNLLLTPEQNDKARKQYLKFEVDSFLAKKYEERKASNPVIIERNIGLDEVKDSFWFLADLFGVGKLCASSRSIGYGAYSYPKWFTENVIQNKIGQLAMRTALAPIGFAQGLGADCYVKCLSSDDNHPAVAWSKVVAWTGDGF